MICYPGMELKVRKKFSVTEKVSELLEKNWSSIMKRRQLLLFLSADCRLAVNSIHESWIICLNFFNPPINFSLKNEKSKDYCKAAEADKPT